MGKSTIHNFDSLIWSTKTALETNVTVYKADYYLRIIVLDLSLIHI